MNNDTLKVAVIDDDGLTCRHNVLKNYYEIEATKAGQTLMLSIYTYMPLLEDLRDYDIISWDNDLGESNTLQILREIQWADQERLVMTLSNKIHIIHSMNTVATDGLYSLFKYDLHFKAYCINFKYMSDFIKGHV